MSQSSQSQENARLESESNTESNPESESIANGNGSVELEQQMVFGEGGDIKPESGSVETSLESFGAKVDHSEGSGEVAEPRATRFGVDDRAEVPHRRNNEESDQRSLFADVENDQQTLGGKSAANRCLFGGQGDISDDVDEEESS